MCNGPERGWALIELILALSLLALLSLLSVRLLAHQQLNQAQLALEQQQLWLIDNLLHDLQSLNYLDDSLDDPWLCQSQERPAIWLCDFQGFDSKYKTDLRPWLNLQLAAMHEVRLRVKLDRSAKLRFNGLDNSQCPMITRIRILIEHPKLSTQEFVHWRLAKESC